MPNDISQKLLSIDLLKAVKESIVNKMMELEKATEVKPSFLSTNHRLGWLSVTCAD